MSFFKGMFGDSKSINNAEQETQAPPAADEASWSLMGKNNSASAQQPQWYKDCDGCCGMDYTKRIMAFIIFFGAGAFLAVWVRK